MTVTKLFNKHLKQAIKDGKNHTRINCLAGKHRMIVLTQAEAEAGKLTYRKFMAEKLWNDPEFDSNPSWLFGSTQSDITIGLVPLKLAKQRLGLNQHCWDSYIKIV